jgi:uncharacterized protein (TIGR03083 family)
MVNSYFQVMTVPIATLHLFPKLDQKLIELLRSLKPEDWNKPTVARQWTVKDIAAHLLDGNLRVISQMRDNYFGDPPGAINSYQDLVDYLNRLNADFVLSAKRLSPALLTDLLESTGHLYLEQLRKLDPFKPALFAVSWAGQNESPNWFHIAREFTEKWHHQQQIRDAVNSPGIMNKEFYFPVLDTFMQALPYVYRHTDAPQGTTIRVSVSTEAGGDWYLSRMGNQWQLIQPSDTCSAQITLHPDIAWRLFTKAIPAEEAKKKTTYSGNPDLVNPLFSMVAVMA